MTCCCWPASTRGADWSGSASTWLASRPTRARTLARSPGRGGSQSPRPREESPREESPAAQDPSGAGFPKQADRQSPRLMGRSRGFWRLTDAADYNRYGRDLLPAWAQVLLGMVGLALAGLFAWRATS